MKQPDRAHKLLEGIRGFVEQTSAAIELDPDPERAACTARWLAKLLEINYCGIYRLDRIEESLVRKLQHLQPAPSTREAGYLFVVSEVYAHGGHTQLLKNLFSVCREPKRICVTRARHHQATLDILQISPHQVVFNQGQSETQKIQHLAQLMARYDKVLLVIHPDDVSCAVAARLALLANPRLRIGLINHSDHTFSVGVGLANLVLEISGFGWALREERGTSDKSSFMGLPIPAIPQREIAKEDMAVTGGSWYKYKPSQGQSIFPYLRALLNSRPKLTLHVIGPHLWLNPWWWSFKLEYPLRVHIQPLLPKNQYTTLLQRASIYIDSYPVTGGMAFTEAIWYGCLPVGMEIPVMGYSALDVYRVNSVPSFVSFIDETISNTKLLHTSLERFKSVVDISHKPTNCWERIESGLVDGAILEIPCTTETNYDSDFFPRSWSNVQKLNMPNLVDFDFAMQAPLISGLSHFVDSNYLKTKGRIIRARIVHCVLNFNHRKRLVRSG